MSISEMDFENEFMSDEEVEEMLENLLTAVGEQAEYDDTRTAIINPLTHIKYCVI